MKVVPPTSKPELTESEKKAAEKLSQEWSNSGRWSGITRPYSAEDVIRLRPSLSIEHSIARHGSETLWRLLHQKERVAALGAYNGSQAVQMVKAGLKAIYLSGWQVAADANPAGQTFPDLNLYPSNSVSTVVQRINYALLRADMVDKLESAPSRDWMVPVVADGDAGFGGPLHAFELMRSMIEAGAAGVHFEDQLASEKRCGHLGGKVLVPTSQFLRILTAARLSADVMNVPACVIARTDSNAASFITSDIDPYDREFITGERTPEGYYRVKPGLDAAIARGLAYAPYCDMIWCETAHPDLEEAKRFAEGIHREFPGKLLAYNCSPSFNWKQLDSRTVEKFQVELNAMGYKFQFITLAGWHMTNLHSFELARGYKEEGMPAYVRLQEREFEVDNKFGYTAVKHQREVGANYFDQVLTTITGGKASNSILSESTEEKQFRKTRRAA